MFVVLTTFTADPSAVAAARDDHRAWLAEQQEDGVLVIAGRREPRVGGVVIAAGIDQDDLERRLAREPFAERGLARHEVVRFLPSRGIESLEHLLES